MASEFGGDSAKFGSFLVDGEEGPGFIRLAQRSRKAFVLESTIEYRGVTGLEEHGLPPKTLEAIRTVGPDTLPETDLASVPPALMWFVGAYGVHTPAALVHDRLIGEGDKPDGLTDQDADRYFRFMLQDLGVRFIRRWLMWSAVALRTRFQGGPKLRLSIVLWVALASLGTVGFIWSVVSGNWVLALAFAAAPAPLSLLWGRQYGAGLVAAYFAVPWVLPPTALAAAFYAVYGLAEYLVKVVGGGLLGQPRTGTEPADYRYF